MILTEADDIHAIAVAEALELKGAAVTVWATSDFPTSADESVLFRGDGSRLVLLRGTDLDIEDPVFDVVWRRRPAYTLDHASLHPADRAFADGECGMFRRSLIRLLAPAAFWVNPPAGAALAASKMLQFEAAARVGLRMPETLFTNSPDEIRRFLARVGEIVYKPLAGGGWQTRDAHYLTYTTLITERDLVADHLLRQTPGIFQELVPKAYEIRVTMIGNHAVAARILSQESEKGRLDWRRGQAELVFQPVAFPPEMKSRCLALLGELGLVFGCFDFIVTPSGEYVFLEVNEMGQFLFLERYCGLPLLDAFSELLLQARVDFEWSPAEVAVRYTDPAFEAAAVARLQRFQAAHRPGPEPLEYEDQA